MLRSCSFFVGAIILALCAGDLAKAAQSEDAPHASPETTIKEALPAPEGLRKQPATPLQQLNLQGLPIPVAPQVWPALVIAAGPYAQFRNIVQRAANTPPNSAEDLERLMGNLAVFDGPKLSQSFHAQAVLWAMQSPGFAAGVQYWGRIYDRGQIIANLHINPAYVEQMPGYAQARNQVLQSIKDDGEATLLAGGLYKDLAYSLQHQKWASRVGGGKALRLAALHNAPLSPRTTPGYILMPLQRAYRLQAPFAPPDAPQGTSLAALPAQTIVSTDLVQSTGPGAAMAANPGPVKPELKAVQSRRGELQDILATAALHILDQNAIYPPVLPPRNAPDTLAECVDWAKLHLNQCVAATKYVYEDSFCIARHQLKDTGRCLAAFINAPQAADAH